MGQHPTRIDLLYKIAQLESELDRLKAEKKEFREWLEDHLAGSGVAYNNTCGQCVKDILDKLKEH